jgi:hypothetical protein
MFRPSAVVLGVVVLASAGGCRNLFGERGCLTSSGSGSALYRLVGGGQPLAEGCYDAVTGQPVPCPPSALLVPGGPYPLPSGVVPGPGGSRPDELPFPAPSDMIPRPGVPFAPPSPAPGEGANLSPNKGTAPVRPAAKP